MKKKMAVLGLAAALTAAVTGCQSGKYQKISAGMSNASGQEHDIGVETERMEGVQQAETSRQEPAVLRETAPAIKMEERDETMYVRATSLKVRTAPQSDAEVIGRLYQGEAVRRIGYSETWSRVIYQGKEACVATEYLTAEKPAVETQNVADSDGRETKDSTGKENRQEISLKSDWKYAGFSKITSGKAALYRSEAANRKNKVVCVNAGHGTKGGSGVKTQCHPDGTPKVTGGTTGAGAVSAVAVSGGMSFADGTPEAKVTLSMARILKEKLLARGYDVLMIRESDDVQLDNIARTVIANNLADCHIALHWDSTSKDKGVFYMSVPDVASYRSMEPVASNWQKHHALGDSLIAGLKGAGIKIFSNGKMEMDLTQTSYSTVPSVDIELGDKASDHSGAALEQLAAGLADGVEAFFGN